MTQTHLRHTVSSVSWRNVNICRSYELEMRFYPNIEFHTLVRKFLVGVDEAIVMPTEINL